MDDRRMEDMLRESWQPQPPDGMRERVLGVARERAGRRSMWFGQKLQAAFVVAGLLIAVLSFASDSARQCRLAAMSDHQEPSARSLVAARPLTMADWRIELDRQMGRAPGTQR